MSKGAPSTFILDPEQRSELLLTIGQSLVALTFLVNMEFDWWEALAMFVLFSVQLVLPVFLGEGVRIWISGAFLVWTVLAVLAIVLRRHPPEALTSFLETWRAHVGVKRYQS
jgi:hypothetical protein